MARKKQRSFIGWLKTSAWSFPLLLFLVLIIFTALKISGSSVGVYYQSLYGNQKHDPDLIYGKPKPIRSDEWLAMTQVIVSQSKHGFPRVNPDMGSGRDISLQPEIPMKDWPTIFRAPNWGFFIMPLEYAFAFKWWLLMYLLIVSCYFFVLRVLPGRRLLAVLFSLAIGLSPFVLWWYQSAVSATLAYGFMIAILGMRLINGESVRFIKNRLLSNTLQVGGVGFVLTSLAFVLYPPFQIPVAIVDVFFLLGYLINKKFNDGLDFKTLAQRVGLLLLGAILAGIFSLVFIISRHDVISALNHTVYPGARVAYSGDLPLLSVFDSFVQFQLQSGSHGPHFLSNQSEDSNFIMLMPFLLIPGFLLLLYEYKKRARIDWVLLTIQLTCLLFFARAFLHFGDHFYKILLLNKVPNHRLIIGIGFAGIIQSLYVLKKVDELKIKQRLLRNLAWLYGIACFVILTLISIYIVHHRPLFMNHLLEPLVLAAVFSLIIVLMLSRHQLAAIWLFLFFALASAFRIIPLYHGLGFITHSNLIEQMETVSKPGDSWGTVNDIIYDGIALDAGRRSITGVQVYPDLNFWKQFVGPEYEKIYNREGHVLLSDNSGMSEKVKLLQPNYFVVKFGCYDYIARNLDFVISTHQLNYPCAKLASTVYYPNVSFFLYKLESTKQ